MSVPPRARQPDDVPPLLREQLLDEPAADHSRAPTTSAVRGVIRDAHDILRSRFADAERYHDIANPRSSDIIRNMPTERRPALLAFGALATRRGWRSSAGSRTPGSFPPQDQPAEEVGVCLKHIQAKAGVSQSTASQFMATLQRAGLVTSPRIGPWSHYRRNEAGIAAVAEAVQLRV